MPQVTEFKYVGHLFMIDGRIEREMDQEMRMLLMSLVVRKELGRNTKLSVYLFVYISTVISGH